VPHNVGKFLTKVATLLQTSPWGLHKKLWAYKVMGVQILGIWGHALWLGTENIITRNVATSCKFGLWWVCESVFTRGSFVHKKWSNYTLTNLLFSLCRYVWIIDSLIICSNPHSEALACPSTFEVLWLKKHTSTAYPFVIFTFGLAIESIKKFRMHHV